MTATGEVGLNFFKAIVLDSRSHVDGLTLFEITIAFLKSLRRPEIPRKRGSFLLPEGDDRLDYPEQTLQQPQSRLGGVDRL